MSTEATFSVSQPVQRTASTQNDVPDEIKRWNWAAFFLNWIWGLCNRTPIALLTFVPIFGLAMPFVLGAKGNEWSWRNGRWDSVEAFRRTQRQWTRNAFLIAGAGLASVSVVTVLALLLTGGNEGYLAAKNVVVEHPSVIERLGTPIDTSFRKGTVSYKGGQRIGQFGFSVSGPRAKGQAQATAVKHGETWILDRLVVTLDDGRTLILRGN